MRGVRTSQFRVVQSQSEEKNIRPTLDTDYVWVYDPDVQREKRVRLVTTPAPRFSISVHRLSCE